MKTADIKVEYIGHFGSDLEVVNAARVSMDKVSVWENDSDGWLEGVLQEKDIKLINYLAKHKHFSPFNHAFLSFRVKAPIFVARQLVKHKFLPWNEVSRRYVDSEPEFYVPDVFRAKADNVKQGSTESSISGYVSLWQFDSIAEDVTSNVEDSLLLYKHLLGEGVCPEQARMVLPQNMMTEWVWSGTLGAFLDMLVLRLDKHTQYESRVVAEYIADHVYQLFPVSFTARIGKSN
jgi:thymidylate synthase (FAD)